MSGLGKQAKILTEAQVRAALAAAKPPFDRVMVVLSVRAGMRACEIANLTWDMVCNSDGEVGDTIALENKASKGKRGGREIPMHPDVQAELRALEGPREGHIVRDYRGRRMNRKAVVVRFYRLYKSLGFQGVSSHSGRRTFITKLANKIVGAGGSLRDVQQLAGHSSLSTTQLYIEGNSDAKRRAVGML